MFIAILVPSFLGWVFFRQIAFALHHKHSTLERYAKIYARVALLWGPLQFGWFNGLNQNHSGYVAYTSKPPIESHWIKGGGGYLRGVDSVLVRTYPEKLMYIPHHHYGVGYKFSLGNPIGKYIYNLLGGWWVTYVMSFVDVLILGAICSVIAKFSL